MNPPEPGRVEFPPSHELSPINGPRWLVWSNEHIAWWGPNRAGYYVDIDAAGRYSYDEAVEICHSRDAAWPPTVGPKGEWPNTNPPEMVVPDPRYWGERAAADYATSRFHEAVARRNAR